MYEYDIGQEINITEIDFTLIFGVIFTDCGYKGSVRVPRINYVWIRVRDK